MIETDYFSTMLESLYQIDQVRFEQMAVALWKNYKHTELYFDWLRVITELFSKVELGRGTSGGIYHYNTRMHFLVYWKESI